MHLRSARTCTGPSRAKTQQTSARPDSNARELTTNTELVDQALVARLVGAQEIIEQLAALRHELEQAATRMIVFHMGLEMVGQRVDAFRQDGHLHFRRTGVAGFDRVRLDDFGLAAGRKRHRQRPSWLRPALPCSPARLNTRLGMISPRSTSARAINWPDAVT